MPDTHKNDKSLFLYTALIFIVAIVIIILAFFGQARINNAQPTISPAASLAASPTPDALQGIAKSASELSDENLELLNENRELNKKISENQKQLDLYEKLLTSYGYYSNGSYNDALALLKEIDYNSLTSQGKILYDFINSNI